MPYILLRELFTQNTSGVGPPFYKISNYYDDVDRVPYDTQTDAQTNTPRFELAKDALFSQYAYKPGHARGVYYDGNGSYYTRNFPPIAANIIDDVEVSLGLAPFVTSDVGVADACLDLTGRYGLPPYQVTLVGLGGATAGYVHTDSSPSELFPVRIYNLPAGGYQANVTDSLGHSAQQVVTITEGSGRPRGTLLQRAVGFNAQGKLWSYNNHNIITPFYGFTTDAYQLPYGTLVDAYFENGLAQWRRVYSDGQGGVYFTDQIVQPSSTIELDNLIIFHPDTPAEQNGGLLIEMRGNFPPFTFMLNGNPGGVPIPTVTNQTGIFDGLAAGQYNIEVRDARGTGAQVSAYLRNRFGKRWQLVYDDLYSAPLRVELWLRGYDGATEDICGKASPVQLKSDGLNGSLGGQGDVPPVVGSSYDLAFLVPPDTFEAVVIGDDRLCRADIYFDNQLEFRGFIQPDIYTAPLLDGLQPTTLTATDGLAALKDTYFTGSEGQRLAGHRPVLNTLLHCLSRCDIALPLKFFVNRRDAAMATLDAPELLATTNRTGYWDESKNQPILDRDVVYALAQLLGGTLVQRQGTWQIRSALEANKDAPGRAYKPAGTPDGLLTAPAATALIEPPGFKRLYWLNATQQKQVRAGWKSLAGSTDVGWQENAYAPGRVFSDKYAWFDNGLGKLQPITGWHPAAGTFFAAILVRAGEKGADYTTKWPRSTGYSAWVATEYLQGPGLPLAAGMEAVPATLEFTGRFVPAEYYLDGDGKQLPAPTNGTQAVLSYEFVVDGQAAGVQFVVFALTSNASAKDTTVSVPVPTTPSGANVVELRLYSWYAADTLLLNQAPTALGTPQVFKQGEAVRYDFGAGSDRLFVARRDTGLTVAKFLFDSGAWPQYFAEVTATNGGLGTFYLSEVGVQLTPQNATWEGEDNFRADGPAGNIRPTEVLKVTHDDVPLSAGLRGGNLYAFVKTVGLTDGTQTTSWARAVDKAGSGLLEANVFDGLALRANPSRLLTGVLRYENNYPPRLLDSLDTPYDVPGRRFWVVAVSPWDMRESICEVTLIEIGPGAGAPNPLATLPTGARTLHKLYQYLPGQYAPYVRRVNGGGVRVIHI